MLKKYLIKSLKPSFAARTFSVVAPQNEALELKNAKSFSDIPGPKNAFHLAKLMIPGGKYYNKPLMELLQMLKGDYGTLCTFPRQFGQKNMIITYLPTDYEKIFRLEGKWPHRRSLESFSYFRKEHRPDLFKAGAGLTVEQGQEWGDFRTKVNQIMMQPRNAKLYIPGIDQVSRDFMTNIRAMRDANMEMPADFWDKLNEWSLESIGLISLDSRLGILNDQSASEQGKKLNVIIKEIFNLSYKYDILPSIWRWYKTPGFKKAMRVYEEGAEIILNYVHQARETLKNRPRTDENPDHEGVLEKLLKIDEGVAVVMAADMIGAGVDTTSSAVTTVWYNLARNPDKQEKLREEILKVLPNKDSKLDINSLDSIPYMRAVIKESLRMIPVTTGNMRSLKQDIVLQGYVIPKETDILMVLSNKKDSFEEPEKFIPERWLKENTDPECPHVKDTHPFAFLPFGFGSRMCIGKRFAELEIEVVTARLLREFKLTWEQPDLKFKSIIINFPESPLKFKLTDL